MLDRDLSLLYQVETRALKQAVNRNKRRFPPDFMFVLNEAEIDALVSQSVIPSRKVLGGSKPYAFIEQGVASLSAILTSDKAVDIHVGFNYKSGFKVSFITKFPLKRVFGCRLSTTHSKRYRALE